jgi:predicted TIM-barrel fold metal-dependent hydrolase
MMDISVIERFKNGEGLKGICIKDSHMHIGRIYHLPFCSDTDTMTKDMKRFSITEGLISCILKYNEREPENDYVLQTVQKYAGILKGQIFFSPTVHGDPREMVEKYFKTVLFRGIKIHPEINGLPADHKGYYPLYEIAGFYGLPVLLHTWTLNNDILPVAKLAAEFPDTVFVMGHMGGKEQACFEACLDIVKKYDNVYADTALSWSYPGRLEYAVNKVSSEKILFGSDANWNSMPASLARVLYAKISCSQMEHILYRNYDRLYGA